MTNDNMVWFATQVDRDFLDGSYGEGTRLYCDKFEEVIHAAALVFFEAALYLLEFKKVISFGDAWLRFSIPNNFKFSTPEKLPSQPINFIISRKGKGPFFSKNLFCGILF